MSSDLQSDSDLDSIRNSYIYTSDIYYHGVDTTSSSFKKEQCDYPDPLEWDISNSPRNIMSNH